MALLSIPYTVDMSASDHIELTNHDITKSEHTKNIITMHILIVYHPCSSVDNYI